MGVGGKCKERVVEVYAVDVVAECFTRWDTSVKEAHAHGRVN